MRRITPAKKSRFVQMLENAIEAEGGSQKAFAEKHDIGQQTLNTWIVSGRVPTKQFHQRLRDVLKITQDQLDELLAEVENRRAAAYEASVAQEPPNGRIAGGKMPENRDNSVPVLGRAVGGELGEYEFNGEALDWVMRPPSLAGVGDAYAVFVDGESMVPRYRPGETVWVHPHRPARKGDDVVVQLHRLDDSHEPPYGYIKEFVGWTSNKLILQQHNPSKKIEFDRESVKSVDTIVFAERV
ncbi:S24 family peptidase [Mesorhizobium sp. DCY119]|uniref:S24 family peptidase n=1 Tax=Mesorhizobium sp. DCY119 TaxID=2108445 RepID=UPI000E6BB316|nr:S24 family peptidase [Mesorhizobium sp. DCY119]RJG46546.1 Repressor protein C [Mesorhizobium sp. DCY119]